MKTGLTGGAVNCTLESDAENIAIADKIMVKGICSGMGAGDKDLGIMGDVYLTRCHIVK